MTKTATQESNPGRPAHLGPPSLRIVNGEASLMGSRTTIGSIIKGKRTKVGWTQKQLSERAGLDQSQISRLEQGQTDDIKLSTLRGLAAAFRCRVTDLLPEEDKEVHYRKPLAGELSLEALVERITILENYLKSKTEEELNNYPPDRGISLQAKTGT